MNNCVCEECLAEMNELASQPVIVLEEIPADLVEMTKQAFNQGIKATGKAVIDRWEIGLDRPGFFMTFTLTGYLRPLEAPTRAKKGFG